MTTLQWHQSGDKVYEAGLDRGVLYVDGMDGVAWNGLVSVEENNNNEIEPVYWDGIKFNDLVTLGDFSGRITAYTYPEEFELCEGVEEDQLGVFVSDQPLSRFGLSYRTLIGEGNAGSTTGYKIHCLYNLTAKPSTRARNTLSLDSTPINFQWDITAIPEYLEGHRPTAHLMIDSRKVDPYLLSDIEDILYGNETRGATLPSMRALTSFIRKWDRLIIQDNGDGTWTAIAQDDGIILQITDDEYQITADNVTYLDADTYTISSSDKNEEDI